MNNYSIRMSKTLFSLTFASAMLMLTTGRDPARANSNPSDAGFLNSLEFQMPDGDNPPNTFGGGVRGGVNFTSPTGEAPRRRVGGGVRGNVNFAAPGEGAPRNTSSGGVRGNVNFAAPGEGAPRNTSSGGVRGNVNFAAPGEGAPRNTSSGGVRGNVNFAAPGEGAPRNTSSGGVRGDVNFEAPGSNTTSQTASGGVRGEDLAKVIPLIPANSYGRTVSGRPTFLVYLPPTASQEVFFSLQDADRNHHYQKTFNISGQGGIVEITLPEDAPELEIGKEYVWFFAPISPDGILQPDNYSVTGWVKRVESPVPSDQVSSLTPIKLATIYAQEGIWYDTLAVLNAAKLAQPDDVTLASEWKDLLQQVGLEAIADQPLAEQL
jgi:hypothetical protein